MIYFDNCATTKMCDEALNEYIRINDELYGNTTALNVYGSNAENYITDCKKTIAKFIGSNPGEIIFTSSATESNNLAILGIAKSYAKTKNHFITQKTEHPAVINVYKQLEQEGFDVTYLDVNEFGLVSVDDVVDAITDKTSLVSIMHINNETGSIMPIDEIGKAIKKTNPSTLFHVDGVQAFGKYKINVSTSKIDAYTVSGHKIYGPKGVGFLYLKDNVRLSPLMYGGSQEKYRPATVNITGIGALTKAFEVAFKEIDKSMEQAKQVKCALLTVADKIDGIHINGDINTTSDYILSLAIDGIRGEILLHALESCSTPIYISTGTSCKGGDTSKSPLTHYGYSSDRILSTIRIGISKYNTVDEAKYTVEQIVMYTERLRKYIKR